MPEASWVTAAITSENLVQMLGLQFPAAGQDPSLDSGSRLCRGFSQPLTSSLTSGQQVQRTRTS